MKLRAFAAALVLFFAACTLDQRGDFLVGRECDDDESCDQGQRCLPHDFVNDRYDDFRCRDRASFEPTPSYAPPLAFCDEEESYFCPGDLECNAERVRLDSSTRRRVCKLPGDTFSPPTDAGI